MTYHALFRPATSAGATPQCAALLQLSGSTDLSLMSPFSGSFIPLLSRSYHSPNGRDEVSSNQIQTMIRVLLLNACLRDRGALWLGPVDEYTWDWLPATSNGNYNVLRVQIKNCTLIVYRSCDPQNPVLTGGLFIYTFYESFTPYMAALRFHLVLAMNAANVQTDDEWRAWANENEQRFRAEAAWLCDDTNTTSIPDTYVNPYDHSSVIFTPLVTCRVPTFSTPVEATPMPLPAPTPTTDNTAPDPTTWLTPMADDASPTHPTEPTAEAPVDRTPGPNVDGGVPLRWKPGWKDTDDGSTTFVARCRDGKLRRFERHVSGWGNTHHSAPVFGFASENENSFQADQSSADLTSNAGRGVLYPVEAVIPPVEMVMEFPRDEIVSVGGRRTGFFRELTRACSDGYVKSLTFRASNNGVTTEGMVPTPVEFETTFDHVCGGYLAQNTTTGIFKLTSPHRIGSNVYTHILYDAVNLAIFFATLSAETSIVETKSRTHHLVLSFCVSGLFTYYKPKPVSTYLAGYAGLPYECPTCNALHEAPFTSRTLLHHTEVDRPGHYREVEACPQCPVAVDGSNLFVRHPLSVPGNVCHDVGPIRLESNYLNCSGCALLIRSTQGVRVANRRGAFCPACIRAMPRCHECGIRGAAECASGDICNECKRNTIKAYGFKPTPHFILSTDDSSDRFYGVELEVENADATTQELNEFAGNIARKLGKGLLYCKRDGSLNNGFEIVSHPFTEKWFKDEGADMWDEILTYLTRNDFTSYEPGTCGMHIHVSRGSFKPAELWRVQKFISHNADLIAALSRRQKPSLDRWASPSANADRSEAMRLAYGKIKSKSHRYAAVNFTQDTIEYRFPRGTTHKKGFPANVELSAALSAFAGTKGMVDGTAKQFVDWVTDNTPRFHSLATYLFPQANVNSIIAKPPIPYPRKRTTLSSFFSPATAATTATVTRR